MTASRRRLPRLTLLLLALGAARACAGPQPLVNLDAADLPAGPLGAWPNRGGAGGQFAPAGQARPTVTEIDGRKGVRFCGPTLASSFAAPAGLAGNHPFALVVLAHADKVAGKQVMVSWASRPWDSAEFALGTGQEGAYCSYGSGNFGFGARAPSAGVWHQIAFVHDGAMMTVYVGGEPAVRRKITLRTKAGEPIRLGAAWDHIRKESCFPFPGALAAVRIYDRALSAREVRNLAGRFDAFDPQPPDASTVEARKVRLAWQGGSEKAHSFEVYLGQERAGVASADRTSSLRLRPQPLVEPAIETGDLELGKTWFWRVDQLDSGGGVAQKGTVWSFIVSAGPASAPVPRDHVAAVSAGLRELRWQPGRYAVSQDVHFGAGRKAVAESTTPIAKGLAADATTCPLPGGTLEPGRRYFWRVDQNNGPLPSARGPVWAFRTADEPRKDDVTFFVGSDCHFGRDEINEINARTIDSMNWLPGEALPAGAGGGIVRTPRGVVLCGDLLDNGSDKQTAPAVLKRMCDLLGLTGEGRLAFPVYEGFGNHDGGPGSFVRQAIRERNRRRPGLTRVSPNGLHYSWDWDHVHLVQLNLFAGSGPEDVASVSAKPHDPELAFEFLRADLELSVGASGRPVVIFQHFGLPPDGMSHWWQSAAKDRFRELVRPYSVVAVFHGHSHAATIYQWEGLRIVADGSTIRPETGGGDFFVVRIALKEFMAAHRLSDRWGRSVREPLRAAEPAAAR